ncbi:unnamed protein product [Didymodactylos carnosus]|uniref:Uncharacterized protein n=1 Tax=Didymodactylos carnosus TaxID=1234261 RepID=A0A814A2X8_9BILA|nr:unnamed protein product [Didymodactylos carnosus]CAF0906849.1 unnamed protein product [Didymodactylos carnosus]CAF3658320.1 unnamed protein product [Didymodactylos carnosus]CAF3688459.1 unnamed protein product [Didymodactylos carnosus]
MSLSSKAADVVLEAGNSFKRIAELTMELVDPNIPVPYTTSTAVVQKTIDSSELKRLRNALNRFSAGLEAVA